MKTTLSLLFLISFNLSNAQVSDCLYTVTCEHDTSSVFQYEIVKFGRLDPVLDSLEKDQLLYNLMLEIGELAAGKKDVLIVVHGMWGNDFRNFKRTSNMLKTGYVDPDNSPIGKMLSFKWPCNNYKYKDNKVKARNVAETIAVELITLARKIQMLQSVTQEDFKVHLLCHSMGNFLLEEMVKFVPDWQMEHQLFDQIILAAPDLDTYAFEGNNTLSELNKFAKRTTIYYNRSDLTLKISEKLNDRKRLGRSGVSILTDIKEGIHFVDATLIDDERAFSDKLSSHSYYRNSPTIERDIREVLNGLTHIDITNRIPLNRKNHYQIQPEKELNEPLSGQ